MIAATKEVSRAADPHEETAAPVTSVEETPRLYHGPVRPHWEGDGRAGSLCLLASMNPTATDIDTEVYRCNTPTPVSIYVRLSSKMWKKQRRSITAHCLAYAALIAASYPADPCVLLQEDDGDSAPDRAADDCLCERIAREMLAPADIVLMSVLQTARAGGQIDAGALSREFGTGIEAMRARLTEIGFLPTPRVNGDGARHQEAQVPISRAKVGCLRRHPISLEDMVGIAGVEVETRCMSNATLIEEGLFLRIAGPNGLVRYIMINSATERTKQRFAMASKLTHAVHDIAQERPCLASNALCDRVAAELLMPADVLVGSILRAGKVNTQSLARSFRVGAPFMRDRLMDLGLLCPRPPSISE